MIAAVAVVSALIPAPARAAAVVEIEFEGAIRIGCLGCWDGATITAAATGVGTGGIFDGPLGATADESTTPDLCTSLAQASPGEFSVAGITGEIGWFRSHNALAIHVSGVNGRGLVDGAGTGTAVIVAEPVSVIFASCSAAETRVFRIVGQITIAG